MTTISDLDRMHALLSDNDPCVRQVARETIVDAWTAVSAYVRALEAVHKRTAIMHEDGASDEAHGCRTCALIQAADTARKAMEGAKT